MQTSKSIVRTIARRLFSAVAVHFWVKPRSKRTIKTKLLGFMLRVPPTVFHPGYFFTSKFMGEFLQSQDFKGKRVLDVGCGSGILSLVAASAGADVTSVDINPAAVEATNANAMLNNLAERISAQEGDIFESLDHSMGGFDCLIANPPYYRGDPRDMSERAFKGGADNRFMRSLASKLPQFLRSTGSLLMVLSSDVDSRTLLAPFEQSGYSVQEVASKQLVFETLVIVQIRRSEPKGPA